MLAAVLNGQRIDPAQPALFLDERGWQYGDALFETMLLKNGKVRFMSDHLQRLRRSGERLGIPMTSDAIFLDELKLLQGEQQHGVVKLMLSRGRSERGYRPAVQTEPTRAWQLFAPMQESTTGISVRWCSTPLSRNALLAGLKHCNRLEQVLAQAEWRDPSIAEGLMLDTEGELICATMSNVFLVLDEVLVTPDLRYSGIEGVMRSNVLRLARSLNIDVEQRAVRGEEVTQAQAMFLCNAVRGIQPVVKLDEQPSLQKQWPVGDITARLIMAVQAC